jgi:hypothetical protein
MVKQRGANDESEDRFEGTEPEPSPARCVKQCGGKTSGESRSQQINLHHAGLLCQCIRLSQQASLSMSNKHVKRSA